MIERLRPHAEELGARPPSSTGIEDLLENGNGGDAAVVVYEANHDLREVVGRDRREDDAGPRDVPEPRPAARGGRVLSDLPVSQPDLFVVCKNCGSEVSPYVTECPYCGQRVRKRAPKIERDGEVAEPRARRRRRRRSARLPRLRGGRDRGHRARERGPYATGLLIVVSLVATLALAASEELDPHDLGGIVPGSTSRRGASSRRRSCT